MARLCNIKVEQVVSFAYDVWCDEEVAVKISGIEGVIKAIYRTGGGPYFVTIDHRYDTDAIVAEILALDAIPLATQD